MAPVSEKLQSALNRLQADPSEIGKIQAEIDSYHFNDQELHQLYLLAISQDHAIVREIPERLRDEALWLAIINCQSIKREGGEVYQQIMRSIDDNLTDPLIISLCKHDIRILKDFAEANPEQLKEMTPLPFLEICTETLKENWRALRYYPAPLPKNDLFQNAILECKESVKNDFREILYVPDALLDDDYFNQAIQLARSAVASSEIEFKKVPGKMLNHATCLAALKINQNNYWHIPNSLRSYALCVEFVREYPDALYYLSKPEDRKLLNPEQYKELCQLAVLKHGLKSVSQSLPDEMLSFDLLSNELINDVTILSNLKNRKQLPLTTAQFTQLINSAIEQHGLGATFAYIPSPMRNFEIFTLAVNADASNLHYLKKIDETALSHDEYKKLFSDAIKKHGINKAFPYLPKDLYTADIFIEAIKDNVENIKNLGTAKTSEINQDDREKIVAAAIAQHGINKAFPYIPVTEQNIKLCIEAVVADVTNLTYVQIDEREKIIASAIEKHGIGKVFNHLNPNERNRELCEQAVTENVGNLTHIKELEKTALTHDEQQKIFADALKKYGLKKTFPYLPDNLKTSERCLEAVNETVYHLEFVPEKFRSHLVSEAIKKHGIDRVFSNLKPTERTNDLCTQAISANIFNLLFIKEIERTALTPTEHTKIFEDAIAQHGIETVFRHLPQHLQTVPRCLDALKLNALWLEYVAPNFKKEVIETITPTALLANHFGCLSHFPNKALYQQEITPYLSGVQHVIIDEESSDHEVKDAFYIYTHAEKRQDKTIRTNATLLQQTLDEIKNANNPNAINLVLIGHASDVATRLAGLDVEKITQILEKNTQISRVVLLGCCTAKTKMPKEEKSMIRQHLDTKARIEQQHHCGVMLVTGQPNPNKYKQYLNSASNAAFDSVYLITKNRDQYGLTLIQFDANTPGKVMERQYPLLENEVTDLLTHIRTKGKNKAYQFPADGKPPNFIRGSQGEPALNIHELQRLTTLVSKTDVFDRHHPNYKETKKQYPFLSKINIESNEIHLLQESLLKKLHDAVKLDRPVAIKGYVGVVSIDTKAKAIRVSPHSLYTEAYTKNKTCTFFSTNPENISKETLEAERKRILSQMEMPSDQPKDSQAKSIEVKTELKK